MRICLLRRWRRPSKVSDGTRGTSGWLYRAVERWNRPALVAPSAVNSPESWPVFNSNFVIHRIIPSSFPHLLISSIDLTIVACSFIWNNIHSADSNQNDCYLTKPLVHHLTYFVIVWEKWAPRDGRWFAWQAGGKARWRDIPSSYCVPTGSVQAG